MYRVISWKIRVTQVREFIQRCEKKKEKKMGKGHLLESDIKRTCIISYMKLCSVY